MTRKIVQITSSAAVEDNNYSNILFALCDDGTVWKKETAGSYDSWEAIENVPQD